MRLLLIRHAEPSEDARGRCYGRLDVGLSPHGREQAGELARALAGTRLEAVYSSPRRRAVETAAALDPSSVVDERLRELDFGEFEGRTYDEIAASHPEVYRRWMETPTEVRFPGGESYSELRRRVLAAVHDLRGRHDSERSPPSRTAASSARSWPTHSACPTPPSSGSRRTTPP